MPPVTEASGVNAIRVSRAHPGGAHKGANMKRRRYLRGFTQVELVVVIAITGLLAAVAIPRFVNPSDFRELGFYHEALSAVRYAQKYAVATGCQVQFTVSGGVYMLNRRDTSCTSGAFTGAVANPGKCPSPCTPTAETAFSGISPSDVTFAMTGGDPAIVVFDALGRTTDGVTRTVTVGSRTFQIIGATGYAQTGP